MKWDLMIRVTRVKQRSWNILCRTQGKQQRGNSLKMVSVAKTKKAKGREEMG